MKEGEVESGNVNTAAAPNIMFLGGSGVACFIDMISEDHLAPSRVKNKQFTVETIMRLSQHTNRCGKRPTLNKEVITYFHPQNVAILLRLRSFVLSIWKHCEANNKKTKPWHLGSGMLPRPRRHFPTNGKSKLAGN